MCAIVQWLAHSLVLPFLGIGVKVGLFQSCDHCWAFQICWHNECKTLMASSFRDLNISTRISLHPLLDMPKINQVHKIANIRWIIEKAREFQRIPPRDKALLNEQCIKLEENNRRGRTRDLFRKTGNIKGTFHPKMGWKYQGNVSPKDRHNKGQKW